MPVGVYDARVRLVSGKRRCPPCFPDVAITVLWYVVLLLLLLLIGALVAVVLAYRRVDEIEDGF